MRLVLDVDGIGHGGITIGHAPDGQAVLVRHALPGEQVAVTVTERRSSYWRADVVEVLRPSPHRVQPPCPHAGPGRCGGCDFQHIDLAEQRRLKARVVRDQLARVVGLADSTVVAEVDVEPVPGDLTGLGWRTRMRFAARPDGRLGLRRHRSHVVEPLTTCAIADPRLDVADLLADTRAEPGSELAVAVDARGTVARGDDGILQESAGGRDWEVPAAGFWQVHRGAADVLVEVVIAAAAVRTGDRVLDLYAGVGLFAGPLATAGAGVTVMAVELSAPATAAAYRNLAGSAVTVVTADVEAWLTAEPRVADVVVLDPPRRGAGRPVIEAIAATQARTVVHVACDPASLARDVGLLAAHGYELTQLRAFDLFPMTHHVECVATLTRP